MVVLTSGPGDSMIHNEKMPRTARYKYWLSYTVHRCDCREHRVSMGKNEVWSAVREEAGDSRFRSLERSLRRNLWGRRTCIDRHGTCMLPFDHAPRGRSFHEGSRFCITHSSFLSLLADVTRKVSSGAEEWGACDVQRRWVEERLEGRCEEENEMRSRADPSWPVTREDSHAN